VCEHLHLPLQSGSDRVLAADAPRLHRRALPRTAGRRPGRRPDLAVTTDIIVGFPGETDDDFERTLEVAAAAEYDYAYTFIYSPARGHRGGRDGRPVRRPGRGRRALRPAAGGGRALGARQARGRIGRVEEVVVEGPSKRKDPSVITGRTRQNKLVHFAAVTERGPWSRTAAQAIGYRELAEHLAGRSSLAEAVDATVQRTRRFAVRQMRWFARDPRIVWFDAESPSIVDQVADTVCT
jgi:tRNA A37 methylthiotransferase MiaB